MGDAVRDAISHPVSVSVKNPADPPDVSTHCDVSVERECFNFMFQGKSEYSNTMSGAA